MLNFHYFIKLNQFPIIILVNYVEKLFHDKTLEIAKHYNEESIEAITNFFADLLSLITLVSSSLKSALNTPGS